MQNIVLYHYGVCGSSFGALLCLGGLSVSPGPPTTLKAFNWNSVIAKLNDVTPHQETLLH